MKQKKCKYLVDLTHKNLNNYARLNRYFEVLRSENFTRQQIQCAIQGITEIIIEQLVLPTIDNEQPQIIIPVLRAGIPMWQQANITMDYPESAFISCQRNKVQGTVDVSWYSRPALTNKDVFVLDTLIATGSTTEAVYKQIIDHDQSFHSLNIISCYCAPEGVNELTNKEQVDRLYVGIIGERTNNNGYIVPLVGDAGDKAFN
jgi:uracil phosphoribosyltransferase